MIYTASVSLLALFASFFLTLAGWGVPVAVLHLAFAVGIVPLIFAAMSHFVPVLTRTGDPQRLIAALPVIAQIAGLFAVAAMNGQLPRFVLHAVAAVDLVLALILLRWIVQRVKACIGQAHPGWRWYACALACLAVAVLIVPPMMAVPALYPPLRLLHLHLNTLGLVGLAALGTLPVLVPTVLGKADPNAALFLRKQLRLTVIGIFMVALGSGFWWPLALAGALPFLLVVFSLLRQWQKCFGYCLMLKNGASASLVAATTGLCLVVLGGAAHGASLMPGYQSILVWAAAFLLPLVTGALSQLLPVWRWPGPLTPERELMRQRLAASGVWRAGFFLAAGLLLSAGQWLFGAAFVFCAMALFIVGLIQAVCVSRSTR